MIAVRDSCYTARTVQAGTPMTVKEMGLPWQRGGPFPLLKHGANMCRR
jgi:hypothetical protein